MSFLRNRWRLWWQKRHPLTDAWTLTQGNIYILPTKAGFVYALTLLVMLVASINYQLNLGYVLTFLLAGSGLTSIHLTHGTLRGLTLHLRPPPPVFAQQPALLEIVVASSGRMSHGVLLRLESDDGQEQPRAPVWVDVPAQGQASARLSFVPPRRGWHDVPTVRAETRYPFGLFRAWTLWRPASRVLAYPAPEQPAAPLPAAQSAGGEAGRSRPSEGGEFEGVRAYQRGDAPRRVVWKKVARSGELVSRDTHVALQQQLWLDFQAAQWPDRERRLSRLAAWILAAEHAGIAHGLRLPGLELPPGSGPAHQRQALEALALWES
ncbi:MAG: DUF58 domain-containing protein [Pseudomonadota bacterium]